MINSLGCCSGAAIQSDVSDENTWWDGMGIGWDPSQSWRRPSTQYF